MAIQFNCPVRGGLTAAGAYVRLAAVNISKDYITGEFVLRSHVDVFKDSTTNEGPIPVDVLVAYEMRPFDPSTDTLITVYANLKQAVVDDPAIPAVTQLSDITDV